MEIIENKIKGVYEFFLSPINDNRGFFMRTYDKNMILKKKLVTEWVQENHSMSISKGTLRGLHFQFPPFSETKLVRCVKGSILDVFLDLRKDSESFGQWNSIELSSVNNKMVYIPKGFAHGFYSLTSNVEVLYKVDNIYNPDSECGIIWNDSDLKIDWPSNEPIVSSKDQKNLTFKDFVKKYKNIKV
tara:strand:- start:194 stop:754 length:561 start_codon:yes stop_codon:yes gene_type:complete